MCKMAWFVVVKGDWRGVAEDRQEDEPTTSRTGADAHRQRLSH